MRGAVMAAQKKAAEKGTVEQGGPKSLVELVGTNNKKHIELLERLQAHLLCYPNDPILLLAGITAPLIDYFLILANV